MQEFQNASVRPAEIAAFESWRRAHSRSCLRTGLLFVLVLAFIVLLCFADSDFPNPASVIGVIVMGGMCAAYSVYQFSLWRRSRSHELQSCAYGRLISKSHSSRRDLRKTTNLSKHYLIVDLGSTDLEAHCSGATYDAVTPGDPIFVFADENGQPQALALTE